MKKILSLIMLLSLLVPSLSVAKAEEDSKVNRETKIENREIKIESRFERASTTERRLENRENNIERIRARIASTTASTTIYAPGKKVERLNERLQKQLEQMGKVKERLLNKELKVTDVLGKIASKIQARITILEGRSLDMTAAKAKLAEASVKIEDLIAKGEALATMIETEITEADSTQLFQDIKAAQVEIRTLAKATHALLVDTIKEITKVLPQKEKNEKASSTATSTNE